MTTDAPSTLSQSQYLSAAGCDARRCLPPARLVEDFIDLATAHADSLDIGFRRLNERNRLWVMGRLAIEMKRWPRMYDTYTLSTRVISFNRLFSERCFDISVDGEAAGEGRTIWTAIDADSRRQADLSDVAADFTAITPREPLMAPVARLRPMADTDKHAEPPYTFGISDLDFNRHVTTKRYVELLINCIPLSEYDSSTLRRIDLIFHREARWGDSVGVEWSRTDHSGDDGGETAATTVYDVELRACDADRTLLTSARFTLTPASGL